MNPTKLLWSVPRTNVDGSPFTAAQYAGFEAEIVGPGGTTQVAVPAAWNDAGAYEMPLADLGVGFGASTARLRTLAVGGLMSDWSSAVNITIAAPPPTPQNLRVA